MKFSKLKNFNCLVSDSISKQDYHGVYRWEERWTGKPLCSSTLFNIWKSIEFG